MANQNWLNQDGLFIQFGADKAVPTTTGDYLSYGDVREMESTIDLTTLTPFGTNIVVANTSFMPVGTFVEQIDIDVEIAAVGTGATFNMGLIGTDRLTVASATGFVNALAVTSLTQGAKIVLNGGSTGAGSYVGTVAGVPSVGYMIASAGTAAFTAGKVKVRIKYRTIPNITQ